tara:strand:- start:644 stop:2482 length:1839 start_codon:yes stop_codon:yes gene_type:complete
MTPGDVMPNPEDALDKAESQSVRIDRRTALKAAGAMAALPLAGWIVVDPARVVTDPPIPVVPGGSAPSPADWQSLAKSLTGDLLEVRSPLDICRTEPGSTRAKAVLENMKNPFFLEEQPGATHTTGWIGAFDAAVSPRAIAVENAQDVAAAVDFVREHGLKLVVKGTGHDYLGRSCAPDSLLVWTHRMRDITVHDDFVPTGGDGTGVPAVTVSAGSRWLEAYDAVTNHDGRYVQGGGCTSVGACGGFILGSGFGALSKRFGTGAGSMLEAEIVTANGDVLVVNEHQHPDLFWALRGGGGGTFGIVTRLTLMTHELPKTLGGFMGSIQAKNDAAYRRLIERFLGFYRTHINNPNWGETVKFTPENTLELALIFIDLPEDEARRIWRPFLDWIDEHASDYERKIEIVSVPFKDYWNIDFWLENYPSLIQKDPRKNQPKSQFWWKTNDSAVSEYMYGYASRWIPLESFQEPEALAGTFFDASRHWNFKFYINKALAGAAPEAVDRDRRTCINPKVFDAAAWILMQASDTDVFPGVPGHEPDRRKAEDLAKRVAAGIEVIRKATPGAGNYANEADYHEPDWQEAFWGTHYPRLLTVKKRYDPTGLFQTHHSVGSEP